MSNKITRIRKKRLEQNQQEEQGRRIFAYIAIGVLIVILLIYLIATR